MRILAIDYGQKRIGLAACDPMMIVAEPLPHLPAGDGTFASIRRLVDERGIEEIVVGYPRNMDGSAGPMALEVEKFSDKLRAHVSIPVEFWDERLTTSQAEQALLAADVRRDRRKELRDSMSASILLQSYMEFRKSNP